MPKTELVHFKMLRIVFW